MGAMIERVTVCHGCGHALSEASYTTLPFCTSCAQTDIVGTCPLCEELVTVGDEAVWTCPRDLDPTNPYWEPSEVTEEQQEAAGIYSLCYEDHGGWCGDHMPMHAACYDRLFDVDAREAR